MTEGGRHIYYCSDICEVRKCAMKNNMLNCAICAEFLTCKILNDFFQMAPKAKANLEEIMKGI